MGDYKINFYGGSNSGWNKDYTEFNETNDGRVISHGIYSSSIGLATDARTANQIKTTTDKLNTGAMSVEVQLTMPEVAESIPNQHLDELNRLRMLTGTDLTLHGPLVEPTGVGRDRWDPTQRQQAERQIWSAVERAHRVKPDGNIVVTLHTSNGLPEPETKIWDGKNEVIQRIAVVNQRSGEIGPLPMAQEDFLFQKKADPYQELEEFNQRRWAGELSNVTIELDRAQQSINAPKRFLKDEIKASPEIEKILPMIEESDKGLYEKYKKDPQEFNKFVDTTFGEEIAPSVKPFLENKMRHYSEAELYLRDAYVKVKDLYNQAYDSVKTSYKSKEEKEKQLAILDEYGKQVRDIIKPEDRTDPFKNYDSLIKINNLIDEGLQTLAKVKSETYKPLKEFAIDQASDTFSNVAISAFNKFGETAPVLSIENPPAGSGINRAEDMKELIIASRNKFVEKFKEKLGEKEAKKQAEKLIGATWDVGHINMIRKYGYDTEQLKEQTKTIAPYVKNIHLSDNFGMEHTELPMGMGNVPMQEHIAVLQNQFKEKLKDIKQVVEVGNWYQHFQTTPFAETLASFGSPIYGMKMAPYWNQAHHQTGGYFAGYGMNPDIHHSIYGAGFSTLPVELGGQIAGRNRLSGSPVE